MAITKSVVTDTGMGSGVPGTGGSSPLPKNNPAGSMTVITIPDKMNSGYMGKSNQGSPILVRDEDGDLCGCNPPDPNLVTKNGTGVKEWGTANT